MRRKIKAASGAALAVDQDLEALEAAPASPEASEAPVEGAPEASEVPAEGDLAAVESPEAPAEVVSEESAGSPEVPAEGVQATVAALQASVEALTAQLQETRDRLEAKERAEQRAKRLEKAGIPASLGAFIRDDADLEALNETLGGLAKSSRAPSGASPTPTLPTVGTKAPAGEILSVDEMIARAEANGDTAALSSLKLAKLSQASHNLI